MSQGAPAPRRRSRWVDFLLLLILVPMVAAVFFRLSPMVIGPTRVLVKVLAIAAPILLLGAAIARARRR